MAKFEMDTEFVRKLAEILEENDLGEIELADGDRRIRLARPAVTYAAAPVAAAPAPAKEPAWDNYGAQPYQAQPKTYPSPAR